MLLKWVNWLRILLCLGLLGALTYISVQIVQRSAAHQIRKYDHANINHMKYSIFSVGVWKKKIAKIVVKEIQSFEVDSSNRELLKQHLEKQLDVLIDKVNEQIQESNKDSTRGWIRQNLMDMLIDVQDIKKGIPNYADALVENLTDKQTQSQLKDLVKTRIAKYLSKTFDKEDTAETDEIVHRIGAANIEEARKTLAQQVPLETQRLFDLSLFVVALAVVLFAVACYHGGRRLPAPFFFVCWTTLLVLLYVGVTTPMIDMDARLTKFGFILLGYNIEFLDQTVYYQSKSILDVFWIMITHEKMEMRFVGFLLILFSIIFPVLKLLMSMVYYYDLAGLRRNPVVTALVLKSGKWSMADVMAVAVVMAFIGFNGMVTTQLDIMAKTMPDITFISTNGTTLQIGFYIFITYVVLAIFFSQMIAKEPKIAQSLSN